MAEIAPETGALAFGRFRGFQDLAQHRIENILLVSSVYDSFILAEDGQLGEVILGEFLDLSFRHSPGITRVSSGVEALELAAAGRFNLIISSMHVGDMDALTLARRVRAAGLDIPVVLLAYDSRELSLFLARHDARDLERVYLWQGDTTILLAIVKDIEDRRNVARDAALMGVQVIIVIEDNVRYYSSFLPVIYAELMHQSQQLAPEGVNLSHRLMRIQARPKILLCGTFEEAWDAFSRYQENVLGVISDIEFPMNGAVSPEAGAEFARQVRAVHPDVPVMLQSSIPENRLVAESVGAAFVLKDSPVLLHELRQFMVENFGFGDFVFRLPDGDEVGRATDLRSLEELLHTVPGESIAYHSERNHFSKWLKARTEFAVAHHMRPRKVSDFPDDEALRRDLIDSIERYREQRERSVIADFDRHTFDRRSRFTRIGGGSLGGKARGLAFVNMLLDQYAVRDSFPDARVTVPPSVVVATDVFDRFLDENGLRGFAIGCDDDDEVLSRFLDAPLPDDIVVNLDAFLDLIRYPLAVRSSSLLEDSQYQPFAGIYSTFMLANDDADPRVRLGQLQDAIRRVFASTFSQHAKRYLSATPYRLEEEKMAVILQKLVGTPHGPRFYPDFAGVARSHNFYPVPPLGAADGVAAVALGLGMTVVDGEACLRFCPRYPHHLLQFSSVKLALRNSQRQFYALQLGEPGEGDGPRGGELTRFGLDIAEADGTLAMLASTYSSENDAIYDGTSRPGVRLISFAPILKHGFFPLPEILTRMLEIGEAGTSSAVEVEFAVTFPLRPGEPAEFAFLQLRPLALSREAAELAITDEDRAAAICHSRSVMGNGRLDTIRDIVVVDFHRFERERSQDVAFDVARFNRQLLADNVPYVLVGVGRWGSSEPFLGIPVAWDQIAGARAIVEAGFRDFTVTPSQGTHFFQNLTSSNVGYFTVNPDAGDGFVDWDWLAAQPAVAEASCVRHLRFGTPLVVKMNGKTNEGAILKPA
ncbi:MAG TPA: PEP/pyruvate-binding domain-containing protein [Vicinamibacterales bacterium]|jgi:CheY-like chemotaxis protein